MQNRLAIEPGDVTVRSGLQGPAGGFPALSRVIGEPYNHAGVAIDALEIHHIEGNGYENIRPIDFYSKKNSVGGAVIRFKGPNASLIKARVAKIARMRSYPKRVGNPFSSANDLHTVSCNEFVLSLFQQAITELIHEYKDRNPKTIYKELVHFYSNKNLIESRRISFLMPSELALPVLLAGKGVEKGVAMTVTSKDVQAQIEWNRNCVPGTRFVGPDAMIGVEDACRFMQFTLDTYTPNSFINSNLFSVVERIK